MTRAHYSAEEMYRRARWNGGVSFDGNVLRSIPDSVVTRPNDDGSVNSSEDFGVLIETSQTWPDIGARLSQNVAGLTRAYVYRVSDGQLMGDVDISSLSAGDAFTVGLDTGLSANTQYTVVADAEGADHTIGTLDESNISLPYTSSDGNLSIVDNAQGSSAFGTNDDMVNILEVGDVGFA
jgi:hypothetical protein